MTQADLLPVDAKQRAASVLVSGEQRKAAGQALVLENERDTLRGVSLQALQARFLYDPGTGLFVWRRSIAKGICGANAGTVCLKHGHRHLRVAGVRLKAHRVAWFMFYGTPPVGVVDHINGNPDDNRIENLRCVTQRVNSENIKGPKKSNKSTGVLGVYAHGSRFTSKIMVDRKSIHLGVFDSIEEAQEAYLNAKREMHEGCTL